MNPRLSDRAQTTFQKAQKKEGIKLRTSLLKDRSESCEGALELFGNYSRTNTQRG